MPFFAIMLLTNEILADKDHLKAIIRKALGLPKTGEVEGGHAPVNLLVPHTDAGNAIYSLCDTFLPSIGIPRGSFFSVSVNGSGVSQLKARLLECYHRGQPALAVFEPSDATRIAELLAGSTICLEGEMMARLLPQGIAQDGELPHCAIHFPE